MAFTSDLACSCRVQNQCAGIAPVLRQKWQKNTRYGMCKSLIISIAKNDWKVWPPLHRSPEYLILLVFRVFLQKQVRHKRAALICASTTVLTFKVETA